MVGAIIGGALVFGVSEIFGEVYHSWNKDHEKNVLIKSGKKLADCTEVLEDQTAKIKNKVTTKKNYANACDPKKIVSSSDALDEALKALDRQIENINKSKADDILAEESNLISSVAKVCDLLAKERNLTKEDYNALIELRSQGEDLAKQLKNDEITNQITAKKKIKAYVSLVQPYIDKKLSADAKVGDEVKEEKTETLEAEAPVTFTTEETKIPDFTQDVTPLTVADVRDTAANKTKKNSKKENQEG